MGKLWKPNKAVASYNQVARSQSIRGQISSPVPITKALYEVANEPAPRERQVSVIMEEPGQHIGAASRSDSVPRFHERFSDQDSQWRGTSSNEFSYELPGAELSSRNLARTKKPKQNLSRPGSSNKNMPQRRKSTIRTTLGRLFGGKKRNTQIEPALDETLFEDTLLEDEDQHYTIAPPLPRHTEHVPEPVQSLLEASTPQYTETPSLHSAAEGLQAEERPRPATYDVSRLSSRFSFNHTGSLTVADTYSETEPVPPLPASPLVRRQSLTSVVETASLNQGSIGMAISSDSHLLKRRSRSLSVLITPQVVEEFRRRSEDVRRIRDPDEPELKSPVSGTYPTADELKAFSLDLPVAAPEHSPPPPPLQQPHIAECCDPHTEPEVIVELEATEAPTINDRVTAVEDRLGRLEVFVQPARASTYLGQVATRGVTVEHVNSLLDLLENERAARIELETQVAYLAHQVTYLVTGSAPVLAAYPSSEMSPIRTSAFDDDEEDSDTDLDDIDLDDMECYEGPFRVSPRESLVLGRNAFASKEGYVAGDAFDTSHGAAEHQYNPGVYDQHEPHGMSEARVVSFSRVSMTEIPAQVI